MAIAIDNSNLGLTQLATSGTTVTVTTGSAVPVGGTVVLGVFANQSISSASDNSGNGYIWTLDRSHVNGSAFAAMFSSYCPNGLASGTVITVTFGASSNVRIVKAVSLTGVAQVGRVDQVNSRTDFGGGTAWNSSSVTPTVANTIVFGLFGGLGTSSVMTSTPDTGWTELADVSQLSGDNHFTMVYQIVPNTSARNPSGVFANSSISNGSGITVNYKESTGQARFARTLGQAGINGATSGNITVSANASVGEKIVGVAASFEDLTLTVTDNTASGGNTYTVTKVRDTSGVSFYSFWADVASGKPLISGSSVITLTYNSSASWAPFAVDVIANAAPGPPVDTKSSTGNLETWSTPNSTTTDGAILYGGAAYRNSVDSAHTAINGTEQHELKTGNIEIVALSREIVTGGTHNISGSWTDASGTTTADQHQVFAKAVLGSVQYARPASDVADGSWLNESSSNVNLYASIDETTANDSDYIQSSASPIAADVIEIGLSAIVDPSTSSGHKVRYRYNKSAAGGDQIDLTVRLMQGATQIASWSHTNISDTPSTVTQTLSGAEADAITDYTNLRLKFEAIRS